MKKQQRTWLLAFCAAFCLIAGLLATQPVFAEPLEDFVVDKPIEWSAER